MNGVHENESARGVGQLGGLAHVVDRAQGIGGGADREEARARSERAGERVLVQLAGLRAEGDALHRDPSLAGEGAPGVHVRVVVQLRDHHLVAGAPRPAEGAREVEGQGGHVRAEGDLGGSGAQEIGEGGACRGEGGVGLHARGIGPVRVRVVVEQVVAHRRHHGLRHLRPPGAVEVGHRLAFVASLQGGEGPADRLHRGHGTRRLRVRAHRSPFSG